MYPYDFTRPNQVIYQHIWRLGLAHPVTLLTKRGIPVAAQIEKDLKVKRDVYATGRTYFDLLLFYAYALFYVLLTVALRKHTVIYTFRDYSGLVGAVSKLLGTRWIVDIVDDPAQELENHRSRTKRSIVALVALSLLVGGLKRVMRFADLVIVVGTNSGRGFPPRFQKTYRVRDERMLVVPNGIDLSQVKQRPVPKNGDGFDVFYVGFVSKLRGVDTLLTAMAKVLDEVPSARLRMVGYVQAEDERWVNQALAAFADPSRVQFLGFQVSSTVLEMIQQADVCVYPFPRRSELDDVYPVKVFEYLALGKAVVATDLLGVTQIITGDANGLVVPPEDPDAMAEAILRLHRDPSLKASLESRARESISDFDWSAIHGRIQPRLNELVV